MWEELLDALLDTLKLVPWLLIMHVLIEVFEYHAVSKIKLKKVLRGPVAPLVGSASGILPQCGFGVVAADLYSRRSIRLGTMVAVFIATSDEAVPILLSAPTADSVVKLAVLLGFKFVAALIAGYALNFILRKSELTVWDEHAAVVRGCHRHELGEHTHEHEEGHTHSNSRAQSCGADGVGIHELGEHTHEHEEGHTHSNSRAQSCGADGVGIHELGKHTHEHEHNEDLNDHAYDSESVEHSADKKAVSLEAYDHEMTESAGTASEPAPENPCQDKAASETNPKKTCHRHFDFKCFVLHPLLHTLTVAGYILAVNVLFAVILHFVGESALERFLTSAKFIQPFLAGLVGLIPNCASSVVIAQMFARGSITLGAAFAGLGVNAGLGLAVLLRRNKPIRQSLAIAAGIYAYACIVGLALSFIPM